MQDHLYTLSFGKYASDVIEKQFFGAIDDAGAMAVPFFADYDMREGVHEAFEGMRDFLAAQLFRTPKGLGNAQIPIECQDPSRDAHRAPEDLAVVCHHLDGERLGDSQMYSDQDEVHNQRQPGDHLQPPSVPWLGRGS